MDALTEVLKAVQLHSTVQCRSELSAPWGIQIDRGNDAVFHIVTQGSCWLEVEGSNTPISLVGGDLVVLPTGVGHIIRDALNSSSVNLENLLSNRPDQGQLTLSHGGGGTPTTLLCGHARFAQRETNPLLEALPPMILVKGEHGRAVEWLDTTLQFIACESSMSRPGAQMMITYLSSILFIQAVRTYIASLKGSEGSWIRALIDPQISSTLGLIHQSPGEAWTVESLAKRLSMSRSTFAARFRVLVGEPPLQYISRWRMHKAAGLLRSSNLNLEQIAKLVGYESEAAFSRAFKQKLGRSPGEYRQSSVN